MTDVRIVYRKYGGALHWNHTGRLLGEDEHGVWVEIPGGTVARKGDGPPVTWPTSAIMLFPRNAWWTASFNSPPDRSEIYVDVTTIPIWTEHEVTTLPHQTNHETTTLPHQTNHETTTLPHQTNHETTTLRDQTEQETTTLRDCENATLLKRTEHEVTMLDLDLDVIRMRDGRLILDDEDEFAEHQVTLGYPPALITQAQNTAQWLLDAVGNKKGPFGGAHLKWLSMKT
ncbi:DUF402 domain-containing protein [Nonomuraea sp. NPDC002799]